MDDFELFTLSYGLFWLSNDLDDLRLRKRHEFFMDIGRTSRQYADRIYCWYAWSQHPACHGCYHHALYASDDQYGNVPAILLSSRSIGSRTMLRSTLTRSRSRLLEASIHANDAALIPEHVYRS